MNFRPVQNWVAVRATQRPRTLNKTFVPQESNGCDRTGTNAPDLSRSTCYGRWMTLDLDEEKATKLRHPPMLTRNYQNAPRNES